jgi:uncharacterized RDD family membrane protein YckC
MWHYADGDLTIGPVDEEEFQNLVRSGVIGPRTLVWRQGMSGWQDFAALQPGAVGRAYCAECGRPYPVEDMIGYGRAYICAECKSIFFQKIKEGVTLPGTMAYAGFWIRAGAKIIDGLILGMFQMILTIPIMILTGVAGSSENPAVTIVAMIFLYGLQFAMYIAYPTFMIGKYGATLGKMACQIRVVVSDGGKITYWRALGRAFAEWLSSLTMGIGYIIAGFDDEKRTLHDRICDTRVVYR